MNNRYELKIIDELFEDLSKEKLSWKSFVKAIELYAYTLK